MICSDFVCPPNEDYDYCTDHVCRVCNEDGVESYTCTETHSEEDTGEECTLNDRDIECDASLVDHDLFEAVFGRNPEIVWCDTCVDDVCA